MYEKLEYTCTTIVVIRSRKSQNRQHNDKKDKGRQTMIYKTLHRKLKIEQNTNPTNERGELR